MSTPEPSPPIATSAAPATTATPGLDKADYMDIRARLKFDPALAPMIGILAFDVLLIAAFVFLLRRGDTGSFLASQVLLAVFFFNNFSILHECGHGNAFQSSLANNVLGHYASTFCFIPYYPWKYIHQKHHVWAGNMEKDPVLKSLKTFRDRGVPKLVKFSWWTWIPISAFLQHVIFLTYPLAMRRAGDMTRPKLLRVVLSLLWMPAGYFALWFLAPSIVRPGNLALGFVIFLMAEELVNLPHHVGMPTFNDRTPLWRQYLSTRSCYYPRGLSELTVLNFNFHIEHHLFPSLPWYRLRAARKIIKPALGDQYQECMGASWNLRYRTRDIEEIIVRYRMAKTPEMT